MNANDETLYKKGNEYMEEILKDVKEYEELYEISSTGKLRSKDRAILKSNGVIQNRKGILIALISNSDGYLQGKLCKDGKMKTVKIHRLVAEHFLNNPNHLPEVNHKDYDRTNNNVDNLEWSTHKENVQYSAKAGHYKHYGSSNPNYRNTTLKNFYKNNPEEKKKLSRSKGKNGRAKQIKIIFPDKSEKIFSCINECAKYCNSEIVEFQNFSLKTLVTYISKFANNKKHIKNYLFEFL